MSLDSLIQSDAPSTTLHWSAESNTGAGTLTQDLSDYLAHLTSVQLSAQVVQVLSHCSDITGGFVRLLKEFQFIPVLLGSDGKAVPLYEVVEVIEGATNYDTIREELPNLSYAQISGALSFLRKIAQFNPKNIDIDRLEDEELIRDPRFIEALTRALEDKETSRVLASNQ